LRIRPHSASYELDSTEPYLDIVDDLEISMTPPEVLFLIYEIYDLSQKLTNTRRTQMLIVLETERLKDTNSQKSLQIQFHNKNFSIKQHYH
jgi:hypothetical protein